MARAGSERNIGGNGMGPWRAQGRCKIRLGASSLICHDKKLQTVINGK
jgi:hypothetical protein